MRIAFVLSCSVALLGAVGTASAQDWTKSKWGPDDEIGRLEGLMRAAALPGGLYPQAETTRSLLGPTGQPERHV